MFDQMIGFINPTKKHETGRAVLWRLWAAVSVYGIRGPGLPLQMSSNQPGGQSSLKIFYSYVYSLHIESYGLQPSPRSVQPPYLDYLTSFIVYMLNHVSFNQPGGQPSLQILFI